MEFVGMLLRQLREYRDEMSDESDNLLVESNDRDRGNDYTRDVTVKKMGVLHGFLAALLQRFPLLDDEGFGGVIVLRDGRYIGYGSVHPSEGRDSIWWNEYGFDGSETGNRGSPDFEADVEERVLSNYEEVVGTRPDVLEME